MSKSVVDQRIKINNIILEDRDTGEKHNVSMIKVLYSVYKEQIEEKYIITEVSECYHVSGDYDYILKIFVKNMEEYREFMVTKLTTLQYIGSTHSTFMIGEVKNTTAYSL